MFDVGVLSISLLGLVWLYRALKKENQRIQQQVQEVQNENAALKQQNEELRQQLQVVQSENAELKKQNTELKQQFREFQSTADRRYNTL